MQRWMVFGLGAACGAVVTGAMAYRRQQIAQQQWTHLQHEMQQLRAEVQRLASVQQAYNTLKAAQEKEEKYWDDTLAQMDAEEKAYLDSLPTPERIDYEMRKAIINATYNQYSDTPPPPDDDEPEKKEDNNG